MSLPVDTATLSKDVLELVRHADLKVMTSKLIRTQLEMKYKVPLREFRKQIDEVINDSIVQIRSNKSEPDATNGNNNNDELDSDVSTPKAADDETATFGDFADDNDVYSSVKRRRAAQRPVSRKPPAKRQKKENGAKKNTAFTRVCVLSDELFAILDRRYMRRSDVVKEMWAYFRKNDLLDPKDRRFVIPDERIRGVLGGRRIQAFGMMKNLKNHIKDVDLLDEDTRRTAIHEIEQLEDEGFIFNPALVPSSSNSVKVKKETKKATSKKLVPTTSASQVSTADTSSPSSIEPRGKLVLRISKNKERVVSVTVNDEAEKSQFSSQPSTNNVVAHSPSPNSSLGIAEGPPHLDPELPIAEAASPDLSSSTDSSDSSDSSSSDSSDSSPEDRKPAVKSPNRGPVVQDLQLSESDSEDD